MCAWFSVAGEPLSPVRLVQCGGAPGEPLSSVCLVQCGGAPGEPLFCVVKPTHDGWRHATCAY